VTIVRIECLTWPKIIWSIPAGTFVRVADHAGDSKVE
jgi:hypothetical protein